MADPAKQVVEVRVHGVGGTPPESLLDDPHPAQVWGDSVAGFYRGKDRSGRHREAYSWGGITSRSAWRVLWLLLLPFMLVNVAGWMCSPRVQRRPRWCWVHRYVVRVVALFLTINLCLTLAMITMDLWVYQCGGQSACVEGRWWLAPLRWSAVAEHPARRVVLGALFVVVAIGVMGYLAFRTRVRFEAVRPPTREGRKMSAVHVSAAALPDGLVDPRFWDGNLASRRLGRLHVAAALAFVASAVAWTARESAHQEGAAVEAEPIGQVLVVLGVLVLVTVVMLLGTEGPDGRVAPILMWLTVVCTALAVGFAWAQPPYDTSYGHLPGIRLVTNLGYGAMFVSLAPLLLLVLADAWARREHRAGTADPAERLEKGTFRWGAPFVAAALAVALLNAIMMGFLIWAARLLGATVWEVESGLDRLSAPGPGSAIAVFPVIGRTAPWLSLAPLVIVLVFVVWEVVGLVAAGRRRSGLDALVEEYAGYDAESPAPMPPYDAWRVSAMDGGVTRWVRRIAAGRRLAGVGPRLDLLMTSMAVVGVGFLAIAQWLIWGRGDEVPSTAVSLGITVAAFIPIAGFAMLRWGWGDPQARRWMGVLWDVGTFWPRAYHPLAPPSYAERAVPELQRRIWWLADGGHPVLVVAHSQGTVLAAAALVQTAQREPNDQVALVTFGSPLLKLYHWGFPAYVTRDLLQRLDPEDGRARIRAWTNFHYQTDYIGGPVGRPGIDELLRDPASSFHTFGQPAPKLRRHTGYWDDEVMWERVDALAERAFKAEDTGMTT